ncbi:Phage integrase, N-terminal SAM-like domain [Marinobacterium sediminicola]|uniref:Phage integrase, N-terminal SAM-like domain n=2 Tax=Marinobacterium sediminicola TaxID=518898 RepID=A0ABY1S3V7_9GAMM|nr:site-specific integrase [Marinobacterium sediminicola]ULG70192.1 phage integrase N-terminal SAM-like domain-containing protein [Marinobacterium sediminicola]SMR78337.1 Phage integrase, N-terminal SAM-like domain [Marinobacterium sediminicola]
MGRSLFLNHIRQEIRLRGYSIRTEKTYLHWIKRYIYFHRLTHPEQMGTLEVRAFLTWCLTSNMYLSIHRKPLWMHWHFFTTRYSIVILATSTFYVPVNPSRACLLDSLYAYSRPAFRRRRFTSQR